MIFNCITEIDMWHLFIYSGFDYDHAKVKNFKTLHDYNKKFN